MITNDERVHIVLPLSYDMRCCSLWPSPRTRSASRSSINKRLSPPSPRGAQPDLHWRRPMPQALVALAHSLIVCSSSRSPSSAQPELRWRDSNTRYADMHEVSMAQPHRAHCFACLQHPFLHQLAATTSCKRAQVKGISQKNGHVQVNCHERATRCPQEQAPAA